jgi:hypothetical protein
MRRAGFRRFLPIFVIHRRAVLASVLSVVVVGSLTMTSAAAQASTSASPLTQLKWSTGTTLVGVGGGVTRVSCASATFCVAGDLNGGVSTYNGATWTTPVVVDATHAITAVSCPSPTFCVVTDQAGNYVTWNNGSWSQPTAFASPNNPTMLAVSCTSSNFCLAVGRTANFAPADFYYFNGTWYPDTEAFASTDNIPLNAVSCTASLTCLATDQGGGVVTFTFVSTPVAQLTHSAAPTMIDPAVKNFVGASISCVSSTSCVVGSYTNQVSTYNGTTWSTVAVFAPTSLNVLVSCAQGTCLASDSLSQGVSAAAPFTTWSNVGQLNAPSQITAMSCFPSASSVACLAVDHDGFSITVTVGAAGVPSYSEASTTFDAPHTLTSVTCANPTYCIASDTAGETVTLSAGSWSTPLQVTTIPLGIREVSCGSSLHPPRSLRCAAVVGDYQAFSLAPATSKWLPVLPASSPTFAVSCAQQCEYLSPQGSSVGLVRGYLPKLPMGAIATDVSCPTGGVGCVAIDSSGDSYLSHNGRWISGPTVANRAILWSVSCVSMSFCVAIDLQGQAFTFNGTKWSAPHKVSLFGLDHVSCGATYFCVASDLSGGAYVYDGINWVSTINTNVSSALHSISCASAAGCVGIDGSRAYRLVVPTETTKVTLLSPSIGENRVGRTIVGALVSAAHAPAGEITMSVGPGASAPSCVATLKKVNAHVASAHCIVHTAHVGETSVAARFAGSFGFAPAPLTRQREDIVAR